MKKLISNYFFISLKRIIFAFSLLPFFFFESKAAELIREFSGKRSITTSEFEVKAPWILDWRINSNYRETMGLEVSLVDAKTGFLLSPLPISSLKKFIRIIVIHIAHIKTYIFSQFFI